ncbi:MAG: glycogen debranching enzyme N-terminal domain-containing protein [Bacteroidetes bacterium]|nr:glycogen debranching enzyme N-terminal domain-containing protein [Bacteroidota bacterium]
MSLLHFNKAQLADFIGSSEKEFLETNKTGAYCSSSLVLCNTRKYHGLLVARQPKIDDHSYVLLASLNETVTQSLKSYELGTNQYPNTLYPQGYSFLEEYVGDKIPTWIFKVGGVTLKKEMLLVENEDRVLVRYTYLAGKGDIDFKIDPFTAFRKIHTVGKSNEEASLSCVVVENGIEYKMYPQYDSLFFQLSNSTHFINSPNWFFNVEYLRELDRGYEFREDLFSPGSFTTTIKKGEELIFSAGTKKTSAKKLSALFASEEQKIKTVKNFSDCLEKAAAQFIANTKKGTEICAGYHWFGRWGRDTFISLPGLTLETNQPEVCKSIIDTMLKDLKGGLLTNIGVGEAARYNSADASLWFFWALQKYVQHTGTSKNTWKEYGAKMKDILENYRKGTLYNIHMQENGLLYGGQEDVALTWMDAMVDNRPVTPRAGLAVDLNALWYNAICFSLEMAQLAGDKKFVAAWQDIPARLQASFKNMFWSVDNNYLADCIDGNHFDWSLRPNQVFAISLPYPLIDGEMAVSVLQEVKENLLTPRGLRTLSQNDRMYRGLYRGDQRERDLMYHQGVVWPWLLGHFAEAYLKVHGNKGKYLIKEIYDSFAPAINEYGLGSIAEIYDGDAPHKAVGTISQAWSIAELLRIRGMIKGK